MRHAHPQARMPPPRHAPPGHTRGYYEMRSMSGRYESYWNAFLFVFADSFMLQIVQDCEPLLNSFVMFVHDKFFFSIQSDFSVQMTNKNFFMDNHYKNTDQSEVSAVPAG